MTQDAGSRSGATSWGVPPPPHRLGGYRLLQQVGEGGMGVVHLALDDDARAVAVKVLRPHVAADPHARARLAREVSTLQRVRHPRVAEVLDADTDGAQPFVVTRYVPGPSLEERVAECGPLAREDLARLGDGLGEALAAIHAAGVVHRDLKPGNVLLLDDEPVVIDFGIAQVADDVRLTSTGLVMGTPGYLSPELIVGQDAGQPADWWGWAATMAFAATGRPPFGRGPVEVVLDRVRRCDADLDGVPPVLLDAVQGALAVDPAERPPPGVLRLAVAELRAEGLRAGSRDVVATQLVDARPSSAAPVSYAAPVSSPAPDPSDAPAAGDSEDRAAGSGADEQVTQAQPVARQQAVTQQQPVTQQQAVTERVPPSPPSGYGAPQPPSQPDQGASRAPRPDVGASRSRSGTLAALAVALVALAAVVPVVAAVLGALVMVVARTVDRSSTSLLRRRHEHGPRRTDAAAVALRSPFQLLGAVLASVFALLLPALVGASAAFATGWLLVGPDVAPGDPVSLAVGMAAGVATAWWGPGGASLRRGSRGVVRGVTPGQRGAQAAVAALALVTVAAVLVAYGGADPDWTPLPGAPLGGDTPGISDIPLGLPWG